MAWIGAELGPKRCRGICAGAFEPGDQVIDGAKPVIRASLFVPEFAKLAFASDPLHRLDRLLDLGRVWLVRVLAGPPPDVVG
jgi:hypothetical protein